MECLAGELVHRLSVLHRQLVVLQILGLCSMAGRTDLMQRLPSPGMHPTCLASAASRLSTASSCMQVTSLMSHKMQEAHMQATLTRQGT